MWQKTPKLIRFGREFNLCEAKNSVHEIDQPKVGPLVKLVVDRLAVDRHTTRWGGSVTTHWSRVSDDVDVDPEMPGIRLFLT